MSRSMLGRAMVAYIAALLVIGGTPATAEELSKGQTVYVSIYSHIYGGPKSRPMDLTAMVSLRNTDSTSPIIVTSLKYYNSAGTLVKDYLTKPVTLGPLATARYIVEERDQTGGSGANFIVKWKSDNEVNPPVVEAVHIGTRSGQGISFLTTGRVVKDQSP